MSKLDITDKVVKGLKVTEDGSLSNRKIEEYALILAEGPGVIAPTAAWFLVMTDNGKKAEPSGAYKSRINGSTVFRQRLEILMAEKEKLEDEGIWGRLEWQARQVYRMAVANRDVPRMMQATETLLKIAQRQERLEKPAAANDQKEEAGERGRGAPPVQAPQLEDHVPNYRAEQLLSKP